MSACSQDMYEPPDAGVAKDLSFGFFFAFATFRAVSEPEADMGPEAVVGVMTEPGGETGPCLTESDLVEACNADVEAEGLRPGMGGVCLNSEDTEEAVCKGVSIGFGLLEVCDKSVSGLDVLDRYAGRDEVFGVEADAVC